MGRWGLALSALWELGHPGALLPSGGTPGLPGLRRGAREWQQRDREAYRASGHTSTLGSVLCIRVWWGFPFWLPQAYKYFVSHSWSSSSESGSLCAGRCWPGCLAGLSSLRLKWPEMQQTLALLSPRALRRPGTWFLIAGDHGTSSRRVPWTLGQVKGAGPVSCPPRPGCGSDGNRALRDTLCCGVWIVSLVPGAPRRWLRGQTFVSEPGGSGPLGRLGGWCVWPCPPSMVWRGSAPASASFMLTSLGFCPLPQGTGHWV